MKQFLIKKTIIKILVKAKVGVRIFALLLAVTSMLTRAMSWQDGLVVPYAHPYQDYELAANRGVASGQALAVVPPDEPPRKKVKRQHDGQSGVQGMEDERED